MGPDTELFHCPDCDAPGHLPVFRSVDLGLHPELRKLVLSDEINLFRCACCGFTTRVVSPVLYHDPDRQFAVWYVPYASDDAFYELAGGIALDDTGYLRNAPQFGEWFRFKRAIIEIERAYDRGFTLVRRRRGLVERVFARSK